MPEKLVAFTVRMLRRDREALLRLAADADVYVADYVRRILQRHVASKARRVKDSRKPGHEGAVR